ncbi:MAG: helicase-related protein [Traorella sp.]
MQCPRCKNEDEKYFYKDKEKIYCRKCIQFGRVDIDQKIIPKTYTCRKHRCTPKLDFELTSTQKIASHQILENAILGNDSLVYACCGAGKTEITFEIITYFLNQGKKVGFAISRRQVVLEISQRLQKAFPRLHVIPVCQGYTQIDDGDLIVCTMHQLYRYHQTFDLLIMDEVDAFPYKNNEVLENIAMNACKGVKVYLTATPTEKMLESVKKNELKMVEVFSRPHGHPLVVPQIIVLSEILQIIHMLYFIYRHQGQWLIFVPTIELADTYSKWFKHWMKCAYFTSQSTNKEEIIDSFRNQQINVLFTTTILERGVTFKGIHVAVIKSDHVVFDEASLIQIAGRVGRDVDNPTGYSLLYCEKKNHAIERCLYAIGKMNETL